MQKQKSKKPRENQKNQKKQYSRTLAKVKMQKSKKPRENQKKQKKQKKQYSRTLACWPYLQTSGILFFFVFFGFLEVFWIFAFLLLQESWNIGFFDFFGFFGFLEVFWIFAFARVLEYCFFVFSRFFIFFHDIGANTKKTCKEVGFFLGGYHIYISGRDFPGRISAGTKLTCNSFLIQCKLAFILINVHFSPFFPWFQCYALFCCKYLYGIAPF